MQLIFWALAIGAILAAQFAAFRLLYPKNHTEPFLADGEVKSPESEIADLMSQPTAEALQALYMAFKEVASRTPLPGAFDPQVSLNKRYQAARRSSTLYAEHLAQTAPGLKREVLLLRSVPPAGMHISPTVLAHEAMKIVAEVRDRVDRPAA